MRQRGVIETVPCINPTPSSVPPSQHPTLGAAAAIHRHSTLHPPCKHFAPDKHPPPPDNLTTKNGSTNTNCARTGGWAITNQARICSGMGCAVEARHYMKLYSLHVLSIPAITRPSMHLAKHAHRCRQVHPPNTHLAIRRPSLYLLEIQHLHYTLTAWPGQAPTAARSMPPAIGSGQWAAVVHLASNNISQTRNHH